MRCWGSRNVGRNKRQRIAPFTAVQCATLIAPYQGIWRMGWDSNPRATCAAAGFQDRCIQPLYHPSVCEAAGFSFGRSARADLNLLCKLAYASASRYASRTKTVTLFAWRAK